MTNQHQNIQSLGRPSRSRRSLAVLLALLTIGAISALAAGAVTAKSTAAQVQVLDDHFKPTKVKIKSGQKVKWVWSNSNIDAHNVTLVKGPNGVKTKHFTTKTHRHNYTFTRKFSVAGKYQFVCTIHPGMGMTVVVKK